LAILNSCWDMIIDQPKTDKCAIDQWSKWLLLVGHSHGGHTEYCLC